MIEQKTMARCNHLLALPFPAAALLANAASAHSLANSAFCFYRNHPQPSSHHLRISSLLYSALRQHGAYHFRLEKKNCATAWKAQYRRNSPTAATGGLDGGIGDCDDIVSSVRDSLRFDLVQQHLERTLSAPYSFNSDNAKKGSSDDIPTLVLVLAVSGGCDSMALFHSALALTKGNEKQSADNSGDDGADVNRRCSNQRLWLHLGIDDANPKLNSAFRVPCELHVAHFNHEQRGDSSEGDEEFVRNICMQNKIPFHSYSWSEEDRSLESTPLPTPEIANGDDRYDAPNETTNDTANFTQDVARKWRQRKLKELLSCLVVTSKATSCPGSRWGAILTAHHRDDADETILLKLLRGSHLTNLSSMDARSDEFDLRLGRDDEMKNDALAHPPSHSFTSIGYFAKPMLKLRKKHIMKYLTSNSLEWREDDSNNSNKYKRNKIRNELLPLLSEITGGDRALQKRLINLEQQSRDISEYLSERAQDYLGSMPSYSPFVLHDDLHFDLVQEEALHSWILDLSNRELQISYDKMLLIRDQIQNHPDRLQWKLDLGGFWRLKRNGHTLVVFKGDERNQSPDTAINPWMILAGTEDDTTIFESGLAHELRFGCLPKNVESSMFNIEYVKDCEGLTFTPPWRKGRSALKLKEFLRGQKVPLHHRDEAAVLCFSDDSAQYALAVYLEDTNEWIVNADFCPQDDFSTTKVILRKTSLS